MKLRSLLPVLVLAACAQPAYLPQTVETGEFDDTAYVRAASAGIPVYRIDPATSAVYVHVGRAGTLKAAGHDHAIASTIVEGMMLIADDWQQSRADLRIPLAYLLVDDPRHRRRFGLDPDVSATAINGTTRNMQEKVLDSAAYPDAFATARLLGPLDESTILAVTITLRGVTKEYTVPCELQVTPAVVFVSGSMAVQHEDFGLTPFSAAGGLLRVAERIELEFEFSARRWGALN